MKLLLERQQRGLTCTIGSLFIDGSFECFVLEDVIREIRGVPVGNWKVKGKTAIPAGTYDVLITYSNRFKRDMPLIVGVPGFEGIRIHTGNTDEDTDGCLLVGMEVQGESLTRSREAYGRLYDKLAAALKGGQNVTITITNPEE